MARTIQMAQLNAVMRQYSRAVKVGTDRLVQHAATAFQETAVRLTPVDTGKARSNWRASLDSLVYGEIAPYHPYPKRSGFKLGERANANAAISQAQAVIRKFNSSVHHAVIIQNNSPYIGKLDAGTQSKQSSNMVAFGVIAALAAVRRLKLIDSRTRFK